MARKKRPSADTVTEVLIRSRRRCAFCFGLDADFQIKRGQIAHLDRDPNNNSLSNLVFLCLNHHDEYDTRRSQAKSLTIGELKKFRSALHVYVEDKYSELGKQHDPAEESEGMLAQGDPLSALDRMKMDEDSASEANQELVALGEQLGQDMERWFTGVEQLGRRKARARFKIIGRGLGRHANRFTEQAVRLSIATTQWYRSFNNAMAVVSDDEFVDAHVFELKIMDLREFEANQESTLKVMKNLRKQILQWGRRTTTYNKGRRLMIGALDKLIQHIDIQVETSAECIIVLEELRTLF